MAGTDVEELSEQVLALMAVVGALAKHVDVDPQAVADFADAATKDLDAASRAGVRAKVADMTRMYRVRA